MSAFGVDEKAMDASVASFWLIERLGNAGLAVWKLVAVVAGYALLRHQQTAGLAALCVLYVGICAWNWRQAQHQRSRNA